MTSDPTQWWTEGVVADPVPVSEAEIALREQLAQIIEAGRDDEAKRGEDGWEHQVGWNRAIRWAASRVRGT